MQRSSKAASKWQLVLSLAILPLLFLNCENPGSVGGSLIDKPTIKLDTLELSGFMADSIESFSGRIAYMPIGTYNDPLFGEMNTTGYLKPSIVSAQLSSDLSALYDMSLVLRFDRNRVYGDTSTVSSFTIYEIQEKWRGTEFLLNDELLINQIEQVGSFTVSSDTTVKIPLSASWQDKFAQYYNSTSPNRDSVYNEEFFGLAIVSDPSNSKIEFPNITRSNFLVESDQFFDTLGIGFFDSAYKLTRENENIPANRLKVHNTLERYYQLNFAEIIRQIPTKDFVKAELLFYRDNESVSLNRPAGHTKPLADFLDFNLGKSVDQRFALQFGQAEAFGIYNSDEEVYKVDLTNRINAFNFFGATDSTLFMSSNPSGGAIRSTLLYDENASPNKRPKIVITSVVSQ